MGTGPARDAVLTAYAQSLIRFKAKQLSRKPGFSRSDEDDVAQELTAHLLARAHLFDPSRASANTFAARVIQSAIAMLLRDRRRLKRAAGFAAQSLERTFVEQDQGMTSLREAIGALDLGRRTGADSEEGRRAEAVTDFVEVFQAMPPDLQDLCQRLIDGSEASVARDLGISSRQVRQALERIRNHFRAAGLGDP
jgi:RNA polymerase sigma-70 factor, ECF subfamily